MLPDDKHILDINSFEKLKILALGGCNLRGQLPRWIAEITELEILDLSYNRIGGSLPGWLGTLPKLFYIDLSVNLLSEKFPQELCTLPALTSEHIALQVNQNYLELPIFVQPAGRTNLAYVRLSHMPPAIYPGSNNTNIRTIRWTSNGKVSTIRLFRL
ncbi:hypothetical protein RJ639_019928 [Escallonia herrerae]|uniref:Uncharacterized protein n=1 Tax=Escallonia herrerae TaxID=1293975 RepID=A0AA88VAF9_9ASTE|nr:hypothetical protein RJ639_019928 [Escallonia herrerae]